MTAEIRETATMVRLLSAVLFLAAGVCCYLFLMNRLDVRLKSGKPKACLVALTFLAWTLGPAVLGYVTGFSRWLWAPAVILLVALSSEVRRGIMQRRCRGSPPADTRNAHVSLKRPFTTTNLAVLRYEVHCSYWQGRTFRVAHISDVHLGARLPGQYYMSVMDRVGAMKPDLFLIAGDFVSRAKYLPLIPPVVARARGRLGTFAILGNHDYFLGPNKVAAVLRSVGVELLGNRCRRVFFEDGNHLLLCGCEEPWSRGVWRAPTTSPGELVLVLTHTADNIYRLSEAGAAAVFAGHSHAGQIRVPLLGPLVMPSVYGRRFDSGHFVVNGTHLFVTAGIGTTTLPLRIYCHPDVLIVDFHGEA